MSQTMGGGSLGISRSGDLGAGFCELSWILLDLMTCRDLSAQPLVGQERGFRKALRSVDCYFPCLWIIMTF